jgi:molybdenum cofactor cytidylyltransferase
MNDPFVAGLVLAAGGRRMPGRPKCLLPYRGTTLLDHTLATARACEFDQLLVAVGGKALKKARERVDLSGMDVIDTSSIAVAMDHLDPETTLLVVLRGDQPGVVPATVRVLLAARGDAPVAVCRYEDRRGHPYAYSRAAFDDLRSGRMAKDVTEIPVAGRVPLDVDTWSDYEAVVAGQAPAPQLSSPGAENAASTGGWRRGLRD